MWYYSIGDEQHGPVPLQDLVGMLRGGSVTDQSLVWREGMEGWQPAGGVVEVQQALTQVRAAAGEMGAAAMAPGAMLAMPGASSQNSMALTSMILGIVSVFLMLLFFVLGFVTAIPAVICGHMARRQIREAQHFQAGNGMAIAGLVLGYLCLVLTVIMGLVIAGFFFYAFKQAGGMP